jgi:hypothetical protein
MGAYMSDNTSWPARFQDYEAAFEELECVSRALKAALRDRGPPQKYQKLIDAEAVARAHVLRTRARLMDLCGAAELFPRVSNRQAGLS